MALTKYKIGDLIEQITEVNSESIYGPNDVRGMTINKEIIPTKADVEGTDLRKFWVIHPREFIFNPRTHGKRIGFGYNNTQDTFIISWNNIGFKVKDNMKVIVLPEYLFLHFNRREWDREACYRSWGSSTEVFTWDALCEMMLDLPSVEVQQKYVDIYNAMLENQKNYERGLEDLKLVCDGLLDKYKKTSPKRMVGTLLEESDIRNKDGVMTSAHGINIFKQFMPSAASSEDLRNYKIVANGQMAYSSMQTGRDECIRIALNSTGSPIIVSPAYSVLQLKDNSVLLEYIMIWFSRQECDRLGWFMSDSSVRANLDLSRFYEVMIPTPDIKTQQAIVEIYKSYQLRKEINEKLKAQIKNICPILIRGSLREEA